MPFYIWAIELVGVLGMPLVAAWALPRSAGPAFATGALGWVALSWSLGLAGVYESGRYFDGSMSAVAMQAALLVLLFATWRLPADPRRLAYPQAFRIVGVVFLIAYALGEIPAAFALPAAVPDIAVAVVAVFVGRASRAALRWFNIVGIADLVVALTIGVLITPGPTNLIKASPTNDVLSQLPLVLILAVIVPLGLALHILSLRRLRVAAPSAMMPMTTSV
jgi:hypothetical protein